MKRLLFLFIFFYTGIIAQKSDIVWIGAVYPQQNKVGVDCNGKLRFKLDHNWSIEKGINPETDIHTIYEMNNYHDFSSGPLLMRRDIKYFLLNRDGALINEFSEKYTRVYTCSDGIYCAELQTEYEDDLRFVFLDNNGNEKHYGRSYHRATNYDDGYAVVKIEKEDEWTIINERGEGISHLDPKFGKYIERIESINDGRIVAIITKTKGLFHKKQIKQVVVFDLNGEVVLVVDGDTTKNWSDEGGFGYYNEFLVVTNDNCSIYDRQGKLLKKIRGSYELKGISDHHIHLRDRYMHEILLTHDLEAVDLIGLKDNRKKCFIGTISNTAIELWHRSEKNEIVVEYLNPITFETIFSTQLNPSLLSEVSLCDSSIVYKLNSQVVKITNLNHKVLYEIPIKDRFVKDWDEALSNKEKVRYLSVDEIDDLDSISDFNNLKYLEISNAEISSLPSFNKLDSLQYLTLRSCSNLSKLPEDIEKTSLKYLSITKCPNLKFKTILPDIYTLKGFTTDRLDLDDDYLKFIKLVRPDIKVGLKRSRSNHIPK